MVSTYKAHYIRYSNPTCMKYKIGIVDDNEKIANQLQTRLALLGTVEVLFYSNGGAKTLEWFSTHTQHPDIVLMDIEMPGMNGIQTTFELKQRYPDLKIIMLTVFDNEEHIFNAIKAGATGYLMKEEKLNRIQQAFDEVMEGGSSMSAMIAQKTMNMMLSGYKSAATTLPRDQEEKLTKREFEILENLSKGLKNNELADKLFISPATVKKHIENIYNKLQLHSRVELVNWFHQH